MTKALFEELLFFLEPKLLTLPDKPEETARATLKALWFAAYGDPKSAEMADVSDLPHLVDEQTQALKELIHKRLGGAPLAHLTGRQHFMGFEIISTPDALIPRKETEILGKTALKLLKEILKNNTEVKVVDVCTGAGNLPVVYAKHFPTVSVFAADLCEKAVTLAKRNVEHHELQDRIQLYRGDLLSPFNSEKFHNQVDLLTCNPPYISSAKVSTMHEEISQHEPTLAFDGGPFGMKILSNLIKQAPIYLKPGGWLAFELGLGQGPSLIKLMNKSGLYSEIDSVNDENDDIRVVIART